MARVLMSLLALALMAAVAHGQDGAARPAGDPESGDVSRPAAAADDAKSKESTGDAAEKIGEQAPPPASPFGGGRIGARPDARPGVVELSDGTTIPGEVYGTRGQALVILETPDAAKADEPGEKWRRVPWSVIRSVETHVDWERMDRQWRFKTAGDPEKVYTGETYPNRRYSYVVTLADGTRIAGRIKGVPVYVRPPEGSERLFVLHERHKGEVGTTLEKLVYVKSVRLGEDVRGQAEEKLRAAAEAGQEAESGQPADVRDQEKPPGSSPDVAPSGGEGGSQ